MSRRKRKPKEPYRSLYEEDIANEITRLGGQFKYEAYSYEYTQPIRANRSRCADCESKNLVREGWYTPDFFMASGTVIEAKGKFTASDRAKIKAVVSTVPELGENLVLMFMRDNKLNRNAKQRYSDWAEANGIDYVVGTTPKEEWL
jgi:hypothetical protein